MYNVYFFTNAAIMKPESKFELNSLLAMLEENEKLREENKKLMEIKTKKTKAEYARIKEIRAMIGKMAHRIAYL